MNCPKCKGEWGKEVFPSIRALFYTERFTPIKGFQDVINEQPIWDCDYEKEEETESDYLEWDYRCSSCSYKIPYDDIVEIVKSYARY